MVRQLGLSTKLIPHAHRVICGHGDILWNIRLFVPELLRPPVPVLFPHLITLRVMVIFTPIKAIYTPCRFQDQHVGQRIDFPVVTAFHEKRSPCAGTDIRSKFHAYRMILVLLPGNISVQTLGFIIQYCLELSIRQRHIGSFRPSALATAVTPSQQRYSTSLKAVRPKQYSFLTSNASSILLPPTFILLPYPPIPPAIPPPPPAPLPFLTRHPFAFPRRRPPRQPPRFQSSPPARGATPSLPAS